MKKLGVILSILTVLTLSFITNNNVFAVSDLTYTITSSNSSLVLCGSGSNYTCSDYSYIILESDITSGTNSRTYAIEFTVSGTPTQRNVIYNLPGVFTIDIPSGTDKIQSWAVSSIQSGESFTLTLSESPGGGGIVPEGSLSITSNGTYDVTNYASAEVNVDSSLPPFVNIVIDAFWKYHVAFAASIPAILAIFFIFRFIKGRIK